MKSEVVYICALFKGETGIKLQTACEVLLFECSMQDHVALVVPYLDWQSNTKEISIKKSDIKYYLFDEKTRLIKIKLSKPLKDKSDVPRWESCDQLAFELLPKSDSISNKTKGEFCLFREFANKYFHGVKSKQMVNNNYLSGDFYTHNMLMYRSLYKHTPLLQYTSLYDRRFKALLRAYVYFLNHWQLNEKNFKKFMRSQENLPNLMKNILGIGDYNGFINILNEVLRVHICDCNKTTHKKCSACRTAASCSMECHSRMWREHKDFCKEEASGRKLYAKQRKTLLDQLVTKFSTTSVIVSYEVFQQELMDAVFVSCCPILENSNRLDNWIQIYFENEPKSKWAVELLSLKKRQYARMYRNSSLEKVLLQLTAAWGKEITFGIEVHNAAMGKLHEVSVTIDFGK